MRWARTTIAAGAASLFLVLALFFGAQAQTPVGFDVGIEGTGVDAGGGLLISFPGPVKPPVQFSTGAQVVTYRVSNSKTVAVEFTDIAVKLYGGAKSKLTVVPADTELTIPAGSFVDSSITVTAISDLKDSEFVTIKISGTATDADEASDFEPTITISTTSDVAPFGVNCSIHTSSLPSDSTNLFHDARTTWSCTPAPASATTRHNSIAGFSFRTAGTYTISVETRTTTGLIGRASVDVTVGDFSGTTYYVDNVTGSDTNDGTHDTALGSDSGDAGSEPDGPWATWSKARTTLQGTNTYRVLFKVGQTHTVDAAWSLTSGTLTVTGPIRFGPYGGAGQCILSRASSGDGNVPFFTTTATTAGSSSVARVSFVDIEARGYRYNDWAQGDNSTNGEGPFFGGSVSSGNWDKISFLGVDVIGAQMFVGSFSSGDVHNRMVIHDCSLSKSTFWAIAIRQSAATTPGIDIWDFENTQTARTTIGHHVIRLNSCKNVSMENVRLTDYPPWAGNGGHLMKLHSSGLTGTSISRYLCFYGCTFGGPNCNSTETITLGAGVNPTEQCDDFLFDSCVFLGGQGTGNQNGVANSWVNFGNHISDQARDVTIRDCRFFRGFRAVVCEADTGNTATLGGIHMYGCSWYTDNANPGNNGPRFVDIQTNAWGTGNIGNSFKNLAMSAPNATDSLLPTTLIAINDDGSPSGTDQRSLFTDSNNVAKFPTSSSSSAKYIAEITRVFGSPSTLGSTWSFSAPPSGHGANIKYEDPKFVSTTDLHLQDGSPCIDSAIEIGAHTDKDADGVVRGEPNNVEVGAYER